LRDTTAAGSRLAGTTPAVADRTAAVLTIVRSKRIKNDPKALLRLFRRATGMTELEPLDREISGLKELLRVAWKDLANPSLTPFERREARNQINQYSTELRRHLKALDAKRRAARNPSPEQLGGRSKPKLRLLSDGG
jgi:hypothetical protein